MNKWRFWDPKILDREPNFIRRRDCPKLTTNGHTVAWGSECCWNEMWNETAVFYQQSSFWHKTIILPSPKRWAQWGLRFSFTVSTFFRPTGSHSVSSNSFSEENELLPSHRPYLHFSPRNYDKMMPETLTFSMNFLLGKSTHTEFHSFLLNTCL